MEKLGQLLKAEREKKGLSLHEIGMSLKINPKILKAIEDNDSANLPAKTFLRGFVRSYAQYLRIDVDKALKLFQEEFGSTRPEEVKSADPEHQPPTQSESTTVSAPPIKAEKTLRKTEDIALPKQNGGRWFQIVAAIFILITIAFVVKMIDKYQKESEIAQDALPETSPIIATTTTLGLMASEPLATPISTTLPEGGMSNSPTTTLPSPPSTVSSTTTSTTTLKAVMPPTSTTVKASTTTTTTLPKPITTTTQKSTTTTLNSTTTTTLTPSAKSVEVIVEALNAVQVKYTLGDESPKTMQLAPDQVHTFKSKKVQLEINDGGAINIIVNGRDRGVPGTIGKPLKLNYP